MAPPRLYLGGANMMNPNLGEDGAYARFSPQKKRATVPGPV